MQRLQWNVMVVVSMGLCCACGFAQEGPSDPCNIRSVQELLAMADNPSGNYCLDGDIDLSGTVFTGPVIDSFDGTLDGRGYAIHGLQVEGTEELGLFGELGETAIVRHLTLNGASMVDPNVETETGGRGGPDPVSPMPGMSCAGALAVVNNGLVLDCYAESAVIAEVNVGGLVGDNRGVLIGCSSDGSVFGLSHGTGGLVGFNQGLMLACSSNGSVDCVSDAVGGLVGHNNGRVLNCYSTVSVDGHYAVGGLVGDNQHGAVVCCYSTGTVEGSKEVGALVGSNQSETYRIELGWTEYAFEQVGVVQNSFYDGWESEDDLATGLWMGEWQPRQTYLDAGWDLQDETANGTSNYWIKHEGQYPTLTSLSPADVNGPSSEEFYLVDDANDLGRLWMRPWAHYRLAADIDLGESTWNSAVVPWFNGILDGNDCFVRYLQIEGAGHLGLFGELDSGAEVSGLKLQGAGIYENYFAAGRSNDPWDWGDFIPDDEDYGGSSYEPIDRHDFYPSDESMSALNGSIKAWPEQTGEVGLLAGVNAGYVSDCVCSGVVDGNDVVGGLVGRNEGSVQDCRISVSVEGDANVGGLVGLNQGTVTQCTTYGHVQGGLVVGGLVGLMTDGELSACTNVAQVDGDYYVDPIVGQQEGGEVIDCQ